MASPLPAVPDWFAPYGGLAADVVVFLAVATAAYLFGRVLVVPGVLRVLRARNENNPTLVSASETYLAVLLAGVAVFAGLAATGQAKALVNTDSAILVAALTRPFGRDRYRVTERVFVSYAEDTKHALMEVRAGFWVADPQRADVATVRSDFRRRVKRRFDEEGLTLAPAAGRDRSGTVTVEGQSPVEES